MSIGEGFPMADRLMLVGFEADTTQEMLTTYSGRGWEVFAASADDATAHDRFLEAQPLAVVFCLSGGCSDAARDLARRLFVDPGAAQPLIVFAGGDPDDVALARTAAPHAVFVNPDEVGWVIKHLTAKM